MSVREKRIARIRELAERGKTRDEIAAELLLHYNTVVKIGLDNGIKFQRKPGSGRPSCTKAPSRAEAMAAMYRSGKTLQEIGDIYGVTRERVRQLISKWHGLTGKHGGKCARAAVRRARTKQEKEAACLRAKGCTVQQYRELKAYGRQLMASGVTRDRTPIGAFSHQRCTARNRGIEWKLTLWQWWEIWQKSGKWSLRGREKGGYVMCRFGDEGAYEVGNVYIATNSHNCSVQPNNPYRKNHPDHASILQARAA